MILRKLFLLLELGITLSAASKVVTYPAGEGLVTTDDYSINIRQDGSEWLPVDVYPIKVDETVGAVHKVRTVSMAYFDFDESPIEVMVISNKLPVKEARVRPLSYGIVPEIKGDTLLFSISEPRNLSVEVNGEIFRNLQFFANPIDKNRPSKKIIKNAKKNKLIYFGPGIHKIEGTYMNVPSGHTVYVDGGARVIGQLVADSVSDVKIYGRGEIHPEGRGEGLYIKNSRNITIDGVIVTQLPIGASDSIRVNNVKAISSYGWGDGFNVFASSNVHYSNLFARTSDDCTTVYATRKGFSGGCRNILTENSVLWADVAHPFMIGLHGSAAELGENATPDTIQNVVYRNIDILDMNENQIDYQGVFAIVAGDNNVVRDITFDNIRIEDFRKGKLFDIRIAFNKKYCKAPGSSIENITFDNIIYNGNNSELSLIVGYDETRKIKGIRFNNLNINGTRIWDEMPEKPKWYKTGDYARIFIGEHVEDISFSATESLPEKSGASENTK